MQFLPFFIVLCVGLFFSEFFSRLHVPWVVALVFAGVLLSLGSFSDFLTDNTVVSFFSEIGLVFLMFIAGLETRFNQFRHIPKRTITITLINGLIPFAVGVLIGFLFGFSVITSVLIGIIFISSSIAVIVPAMHEKKLFSQEIGKVIIQSTIINDIVSLLLLSLVIQKTATLTSLPILLYLVILVSVVVFLKWFIPRFIMFFNRVTFSKQTEHESSLRLVFVVLIGSVLLFQVLGMHPIIAGFFTGLVISESRISSGLRKQINTLAYGLFIPMFFVVVGSSLDISLLWTTTGALLFTLVIVFGSSLAKYLSGFWAGRLAGFSVIESKILGSSTIPQLSTTLATVFAGVSLGIVPPILETALIVLSVVSTLIAPFLINYFTSRFQSV